MTITNANNNNNNNAFNFGYTQTTSNARYESSNIFVHINENKECLLSISIYDGISELHDFDTNDVSYVPTYNFAGYNIQSTSCVLFGLSNGNKRIFFCFKWKANK